MSANTFDDKVADVYVEHLAAVSQSNEVLAEQDIYNEFGVLLVKKGVPISNKTAAHLANHRLTKPVDDVVRLTKSINNQTLLYEFNEMLGNHADFKEIQRANEGEVFLRHLCVADTFPQPILQKLTVLKDRFPEAYQRTLFGAWFCGLVAKELNWSKGDAHVVFTAALFQDLGLLHIPIEVVGLTQDFSEEQWRAIQSHVLISSILVENLEVFPALVVRAIVEHHERQDGTGYPAKKNADQLCEAGKLVGLVDLIYRLWARTGSADKEPVFSEVVSYLKINNRPDLSRVYSGCLAVIKRAKIVTQRKDNAEDKNAIIQRINKRSKAIQELHQLILQVQPLLSGLENSKDARTILILVEKVKFAYISAGFFHDGFFEGLGEFSADELEDADRMQVEISWIIKRVLQAVPRFIENEQSVHKDCCESLNNLSESLQAQLKSLDT